MIVRMNLENLHATLSPVFASIEKLTNLPEPAKQAFVESVRPMSFAKNDYLLNSGQTDTGLFLIVRGMVRFVYLSHEGKEFNKSFAAEGEFVGCLLSMLSDQVCRFSIQAIENTDTFYLSNQSRKRLFQNFPAWERLGRIMAEQLALKKEAREAEFLLDSAQTRYQNFVNEHPNWVNRLTQYHIASYLGITDVALSRIRHKKI